MAILAVLLSHTAGFLAPLTKLPFTGTATGLFIRFTQPLGQLGVELFFVLSGFLIGGILIRSYMGTERFSIGHVRHFLVRRWFRTLPAYWLVLTADIVLYLALFGKLEPYKFLYYFFLQNLWYPHPPYFFGEAWSLAVEEWCYLLLPLSLYVADRLFRPHDKKKFLLRLILVFMAMVAVARVINAMDPLNGPDQDSGIRKVVVFRLDALLYGMLWSYLLSFRNIFTTRIKGSLFLAGILSVSILYYLVSLQQICGPAGGLLKMLSDAFLYLLLPLSFSLLLPYAAGIKTISWRTGSNIIQFISRISYSLYLVHYSLVFIPFFSFLKIEDPLAAGGLYLLYWGVTLLLSWMLYRYFEYPLMQLRERLPAAKESMNSL
jgi:peptidoglycan/LPS O-acetylase OafA/YrhL